MMIDYDDFAAIGGMSDWQGKPKYCPSAALSSTNPTRLEEHHAAYNV
jgi:hypothetical protein